jgi:cytohesin
MSFFVRPQEAKRMTDESPLPASPLLAALWERDWASALALVAAGANPNIADTRSVGQDWTPLHFAVEANGPELAQALIAAGAVVDARSVVGQTPLWWACNNGNTAVVKMLLAAGADPNARSTEGYSPLGRVLRSDTELVELMRNSGGVV